MSSPKPLTERQHKQLSLIRERFRGKTLLISPSANHWTAEAREPRRQEYLLQQVELAKSVRQRLENAADQVSKLSSSAEIKDLILKHAHDTNQLISLTEAIRGKYVLSDGYNEYNQVLALQQQSREKALNDAKEILTNQLDRMANPTKNWPSRTMVEDLPPPSRAPRHNYFEIITDTAAAATNKASSQLKDPPTLETVSGELVTSLPTISSPTATDEKNVAKKPPPAVTTSEVAKPAAKQPHPASTIMRMDEGINQALATQPHGKEKRLKRPSEAHILPSKVNKTQDESSRKRELVMPDDVPSHSIAPRASPPVKKRKRSKPGAPKRCHNCKTKHTDFLKCCFFLPTGHKCGKFYCKQCLSTEYTDFDTNPKNLKEWHCPSCLGVCKCPRCEGERDRAERAQKVSSARPSRRSRSALYE